MLEALDLILTVPIGFQIFLDCLSHQWKSTALNSLFVSQECTTSWVESNGRNYFMSGPQFVGATTGHIVLFLLSRLFRNCNAVLVQSLERRTRRSSAVSTASAALTKISWISAWYVHVWCSIVARSADLERIGCTCSHLERTSKDVAEGRRGEQGRVTCPQLAVMDGWHSAALLERFQLWKDCCERPSDCREVSDPTSKKQSIPLVSVHYLHNK